MALFHAFPRQTPKLKVTRELTPQIGSVQLWAIEGVAMSAVEAKNPRKSIPRAYIGGILTMVVLARGVMFFAGGVGE